MKQKGICHADSEAPREKKQTRGYKGAFFFMGGFLVC